MQSYPGIYISKLNFTDPGSKPLASSSVNYWVHQKPMKKPFETFNDLYKYENQSHGQSKENIFPEPIFSKKASIDFMKKSIHPASSYTVNSSNEKFMEKHREDYKRYDCVLSEKTNTDSFSKSQYTAKSINFNKQQVLKPQTKNRKSFASSGQETMLPLELKEFFRERSKSKERSPMKKNLHEKQNISKTWHTRHPSSYGYLSNIQLQPQLSLRSNCPSKKNLQSYSTFFVDKNPSLPKTKTPQKAMPIIEPLNFKKQSNVEIYLSSQESISEDTETTARFNFSEEKMNSSERDHSESLKTSLGKRFSQKSKRRVSLSNFILGVCKGKGRYGKVYLAIQRQTGFIFALKEISITVVKQMMDQFISQLKIQLFLHHPYITKVYGYFIENDNIYLIMEYMTDGNLYEKIKKRGPIPQKRAACKLYQISQGVKEMHYFNVIHRDLKPQNIVLTFDVCKICDFSWAAKSNERRQTNCGTLDYLSPEMISGEGYSNSIDLWAMGVLLYEMLVGKPPFYNMSAKQTTKRIKQCLFTLPDSISKHSKELIECFLRKDPEQRKQIEQIMKHPFFQNIQQ